MCIIITGCVITYLFTHLEVIAHTLDDNYVPPVESASTANVEPNTSIEDHESIVTSYKELIRDQVGKQLTSFYFNIDIHLHVRILSY